MQQLSPAGRQALDDIARRHGFSSEAVTSMLWAVVQGHGSMAQFGHPEFGGAGQWMRGGMTMVSDMFNNALKARVDGLCSELAALVASQPELLQGGSFQSQSQGGSGGHEQQQSSWSHAQPPAGAVQSGTASLFIPASGGDWWGPSLRWPDSTGSQNGVRYAYFAQARRLAIEVHGRVTIYDTLDHHIGGFSQQQSGSGSLSFTSQYGLVDVASLPVVSIDGQPPAGTAAPVAAAVPPTSSTPAVPPTATPGGPQGLDVFAAIDKLAELHARGVLTAEEFSAKKAELLSRL
ncbi:SHOCT domain-containing protein [Azohydromonas caseinilytica]|uniref:SHOCT domain-containing protein n=1 Tax=Azohydromonas caseinilytica TaxID=2728836 RepID=A0A848FGD5_9BURK|nr:SHOCT domain-containing protein [Azohydromonas caseinilytica]NML18322.1 SHOCT domain-containing protein [Azohydromonas caseinilytica]